MPLNRMPFMNIYLDNVTHVEALTYMDKCIRERKTGHIITPNVDQIVRLETDAYFKKICESAELLLVDGHPLLWIAKLYGTPLKAKFNGTDLVNTLCEWAAEKNYSIFLLGAAPGVADKAAERLMGKYPKITIAGTYSPPMGFEKDPAEIEKIDCMLYCSHADMLFVGMGAPKQDIFIYENKDKYQIPLSFSVGAAIDFIAGQVKRAPKWMTNHGLEWFYRFLQEPGRMFKRYFVDDTKIVWLAWKYRKNATQKW